MEIQNKVALVTGAGRGIGRAIALELAREGASLALVSRTMKYLQGLAKEVGDMGRKSMVFEADVTRESLVKDAVAQAVRKFGGIDILVNNAGVGRFARVEEMTTQDWDDMFEVNLRAMFICTREALPSMKNKQESVIVNIASLAGKNAFGGGAGYAATKWGVLAFSKCLMLEERDAGVKVIAVCPGSVDTHFFSHESMPKPDTSKILKPTDVAKIVVEAIKLPQRAMVSELDIRPAMP